MFEEITLSELFLILFGIFTLGCVAKVTIDEVFHAPRCEHNKRNGTHRKWNGKLKCHECQLELEQKQKVEHEKRQKEKEYSERHEEIQNKFSELLKQAVLSRKKFLLFDEESIRKLSPLEFENFIAVLYTQLGYEIEQTPYANDGGKDAFAYKDGKAYLIECKHYQKDAVIGRPMLQKLYAAMTEEHIENGIFISTCEYSKPALDYGRKMNIKTMKMCDILELLQEVNVPHNSTDKNYIISCRTCGEEITFCLFGDVENKKCSNGHVVKNVFWNTKIQEPICPKCGGKYHLVHGRYETFYGCSNYPKCSHKMNRNDYEVIIGIRRRRKLTYGPR